MMRIKTIFLILLMVMISFSNQPVSGASITVNLSIYPTPAYYLSGNTIYVSVSTSTSADLSIYFNGVLKYSCSSCTSMSYKYINLPYSGGGAFEVKALAVKFPNFGSNIKHIMVYDFQTDLNNQYVVANDWLQTDSRYQQNLENLRDKIASYAVNNYYGWSHPDYSNQFLATSVSQIDTDWEKIMAIMFFANDLMLNRWFGDSDTLSGPEVSTFYGGFNPSWSKTTARSYSLQNPYNIPRQATPNAIDCSDMASLITALATNWGLKSRIISLTSVETNYPGGAMYEHLFAEVYGLNVHSNNGWFLIDPAKTTGMWEDLISSFSPIAVQKAAYDLDDDDTVQRLWIVSGWSMNYGATYAMMKVGSEFTRYSEQNRRMGWGDDPLGKYIPFNAYKYTSNPWSITNIQQAPSCTSQTCG